MNKAPAFQFYPAEYLADESVQLLSLAEEGAYIRALSYCWREGSIPSDPIKLSRLIGKECSQAIAEAIVTLFETSSRDTSRLIHKRLEQERAKQQKFKKTMSEAGKKGASTRWDSQKKEWPGHSQAITKPMASDSSSSSISSSISTSSSSKKINKKEAPPEVMPYVHLSEENQTKLKAELGEQVYNRCLEKLSAFVGSNPKPDRIKNGINAIYTLRSWVIAAVLEEKSKAQRTQGPGKPQSVVTMPDGKKYSASFIANMEMLKRIKEEEEREQK